jgi:hypothetical protein
VETKYGMQVLMALSEEGDNTVEVFLPKRYGDVIDETNMIDINNRHQQYYLFYNNTSLASKALIVQLEM